MRNRSHRRFALEMVWLAACVPTAFVVASIAAGTFRARAGALSWDVTRDVAGASGSAARAAMLFAAGVVLLAIGRVVGQRRGRTPIAVPFLVPATATACLLGLVVHLATVETAVRGVAGARHLVVLAPTGVAFAEGFAMGSLAAMLLMIAPLDPAALATRLRLPATLAIGAIFTALAVFGSGPRGSGTRINLGPVQPIEAVKVLLVVVLAAYLGPRAPKLRWQRERFLGLRWPRPALFVPAVLVLLAIAAGLFLVGDLGPVTILAFVFLGMFYVASRASGWALVSLAIVALLAFVVANRPELVGFGRVVTRVRMWRDPFGNGIAYGDQLGEALWAIAAGGVRGQGLSAAHAPLLAAGKTDLALATLAEQLGAVAILLYVGLVAAIAASALYVAARARTSEHALLASGAALLLVTQWATIHAGTYGAIPLTGVVVPFVSAGRSSMIAFVAIVGVVARLAEDGAVRVESPVLDEVHAASRVLGRVLALVFVLGSVAVVRVGVLDHDAITTTTLRTRRADGSLEVRSNPRLVAMARALHRGPIVDRNGEPIAIGGGPHASPRTYPIGRAMGTLIGVHPSAVLLPRWSLERSLDGRLRGYGTRTVDGRAEPDLRAFAALLDEPRDVRASAMRALDADVARRTVRLSIDSRLQRRAAELLARAARERSYRAVAAAVIDVDSGDVLARVQVPDLDPADPAWQLALSRHDESVVPTLTGAYGAWPDKTGAAGHFQSGSIAKLFTALAAVRQGGTTRSSGCDARSGPVYGCTLRDADGPYFTRPGWERPVHDHANDGLHGSVDLVEAIAVSCNVYFGQLALSLGPEPLVALHADGVDVGFGRDRFVPGAAGSRQLASTGFGQGAMVMNVVEAARLVAAIGGGGHYRRCSPALDRDAPCTDVALVDDASSLAPILAGMRRVLTDGTGRSLDEPEGLRVYGKTGTADVRGFVGEAPFGIAPGSSAPPHSWFVALIEPESLRECAVDARGRIAIAVVVPRGGSGARAAGPIAMGIAAIVQELGLIHATP